MKSFENACAIYRKFNSQKNAISRIKMKLNSIMASIRFAIKPTLILTLIYLVGFSAIIQANFNYIDDMGRASAGYKGWDNFSRYTSNFLSSFIHVGNYLTDISPLTQIIAVIELAIASVIVIYLISGKKNYSIWMLIAVLPLGMSPYFLECISYKFDSPYMALSILASVVPLLLAKQHKIIYALGIIAGELIVCTTYQAASGILPMLAVLLACKAYCQGKKLKNVTIFVLVSIVACGVALVIFKLFIMQPASTYVSNGLPPLSEILPTTITHYKKYCKYVLTDFKSIWTLLCVLIVIAFLVTNTINSKHNIFRNFIASVICLIIMGCLIFGLYPILEKPLFAPRAMYGVGAFLAFLGVAIAASRKALIGNVVVAILAWCFFVFAFTYGNALYVQSQWTDFRITSVVQSLNEIEEFSNDSPKTIQVEGSIGQSPILKNQPQNYQMLNRLVPITFQGKWAWGICGINSYYGLKHTQVENKDSFKELKLPLRKETMYFDIFGENDKFLIVLK
ncbi:glucosyltransferase domain-containing protein [Adlercreutzia sp. ZJ154]|uniref:glucosyltransferase domain-containing protein n=1 Tax=Adlercreutzia sp. ZJ154 TaxID=2709790 RepID=UPI0013EE192F|nr:glucosyltransferase domain-containing protein [Adlercreutzia sp. ZJ154]